MTRGYHAAIRAGMVVLAYASGAVATEPARPKKTAPVSADCGTVALYALLDLEGRPTPLDRVAAHLPPPRVGGHSMKELRETARSFGLRLDGLYLGKDPRAIDRPMLAFLKVEKRGHFLVVRPVGHTGRLIQVIDSDQPPRVMDRTELVASAQWTGVVLAPARIHWRAALAGGLLAPVAMGCWWLLVRGRDPAGSGPEALPGGGR